MSSVIDTSAILAVHKSESGSEVARRQARGALVSAVSHAEVVSYLVRAGHSMTLARGLAAALAYVVVPFDEVQAEECGRLQRFTHHLRLSLADRACLALARLGGHEVVTADRSWAKLSIGVMIRTIR